jgi:predicted transcriptional regulator
MTIAGTIRPGGPPVVRPAALFRRLLGTALRSARSRQGRTLREVSAAAGVSLGYLSEIERGRKEASSELLAAISAALGVRLADLLVEVGRELARVEPVPVPPPAGVPVIGVAGAAVGASGGAQVSAAA